MKPKVTDSSSRDNPHPEEESGISSAKTVDSVRLQVYLAHAGVASRRSAEKIILDGRVTVNGVVVTGMGTKVFPHDQICVDGKNLSLETIKRYILLNKPSGYVCSSSDEKGRSVAVDLLKGRYGERLYSVGRLDMYSTGAILFTNDGDFAACVGHPSAEIEKEYLVETSLPFRDDVLRSFTQGVRVDSVFYRCKSAVRLSSRKLKVILIEGKNREIRRVLAFFGLNVRSLSRTRIGPVELGQLPIGEYRELTEREISALMGAAERSVEENGDSD